MSRQAIAIVSRTLAQQHGENNLYIKDSEHLYRGPNNVVQRLNIVLQKECLPSNRIAFAGWLVDREISSTKDLTVAEALAIVKSEPDMKRLYRQFVQETGVW